MYVEEKKSADTFDKLYHENPFQFGKIENKLGIIHSLFDEVKKELLITSGIEDEKEFLEKWYDGELDEDVVHKIKEIYRGKQKELTKGGLGGIKIL